VSICGICGELFLICGEKFNRNPDSYREQRFTQNSQSLIVKRMQRAQSYVLDFADKNLR